jgi:phosphoribosylformylglycinamidine (FGAM) synthase-like enzyme
LAKRIFLALHQAIHAGLVRACHDLSEGGLAAAAAEMAFAGGYGAKIDLRGLSQFLRSKNGTVPLRNNQSLPLPPGEGQGEGRIGEGQGEAILLFSESNTRFLCEVAPENAAAFESALAGSPHARVGEVTEEPILEIVAETPLIEAEIVKLKEAWQKPLQW